MIAPARLPDYAATITFWNLGLAFGMVVLIVGGSHIELMVTKSKDVNVAGHDSKSICPSTRPSANGLP